jgi:ABC-2 type transport system ATP-binding protein
VVAGAGLDELAVRLRGQEGIDMVTRFGTSLHVSGHDRGKLEAALAPFLTRPALDWRESEPSLEDVFIQLMGKES